MASFFAFEAVPTILLELSVVAKLIKSYQHEVMMKHSGGSGALFSLPSLQVRQRERQ